MDDIVMDVSRGEPLNPTAAGGGHQTNNAFSEAEDDSISAITSCASSMALNPTLYLRNFKKFAGLQSDKNRLPNLDNASYGPQGEDTSGFPFSPDNTSSATPQQAASRLQIPELEDEKSAFPPGVHPAPEDVEPSTPQRGILNRQRCRTSETHLETVDAIQNLYYSPPKHGKFAAIDAVKPSPSRAPYVPRNALEEL